MTESEAEDFHEAWAKLTDAIDMLASVRLGEAGPLIERILTLKMEMERHTRKATWSTFHPTAQVMS